MKQQIARDSDETTRSTICGQICWPRAHGGRLLRGGRVLVVLKMVNDVESMDSTIRAQLKLTPRRKNLATRTRFLTFYINVSKYINID